MFDPQRLARIDAWAAELVDSERLPHACVLLHHGGREVFACFHGMADIEMSQPIARDSLVRLYSMTKPVTALALMQLVARGQVTLDTPVSAVLPEFLDMQCLVPGATSIEQTQPCRPPTLHELMLHTSGLSYSFNKGPLAKYMGKTRIQFGPHNGKLADLSVRVAAAPLAFAPGTRWEYSVGMDILGRVIEVLSGQSLEQYFTRHILEPLGMHDTGFRVPSDKSERFTALYMPKHGTAGARRGEATQPGLRVVERPGRSHYHQTETFSGGGGLVGTIDDYMRFVDCLRLRGGVPGPGAACQAHHVLPPRLVDFMLQNHLPGDIAAMGPSSFAEMPTGGMGFGLGGSVVIDPPRTGAPGSPGDFAWGGMASTFFWLDPVVDLAAVFITQLTPSGAYPVRPQLKALVHAAMAS